MTVQLDWPPDVVAQLTEEARQRGLTLEAYLLEAVSHKSGSTVEAQQLQQRAKAVATIRELRSRVKPDPEGWTSRDYINAGSR